MFEKDNPLASKASSEENDDSAGLERWTGSCGMDGFSGLRKMNMLIHDSKRPHDSSTSLGERYTR